MYAEVIALLVSRLGGRVIVTGAGDEAPLVASIFSRLDSSVRERVVPAAGLLSFPGLCAAIEAADLVVTNNTGPMHVSAAVNTPVIALFALTNPPEQWGPWRVPHRLLWREVPCRLCYSRICPTSHDCLTGVHPEAVLAAADDLLHSTSPHTARAEHGGLDLVGARQ
jgi:ADP-heptose:LPS heptosyltransferase